MNKRYLWDDAKNVRLQRERGVSFEEVYYMVEHGNVLDVVSNPNQKRYPGQRMFIIEMKHYAWVIPFLETEEEIFLKTAIPSRKMTKIYIKEAQTDEKD